MLVKGQTFSWATLHLMQIRTLHVTPLRLDKDRTSSSQSASITAKFNTTLQDTSCAQSGRGPWCQAATRLWAGSVPFRRTAWGQLGSTVRQANQHHVCLSVGSKTHHLIHEERWKIKNNLRQNFAVKYIRHVVNTIFVSIKYSISARPLRLACISNTVCSKQPNNRMLACKNLM